MSDKGMTRNEILGRMRDEGYAAVLVNRIESLLDAAGGDIATFAGLTRGQLMGLYNNKNPYSVKKGLGDNTFKAFDRFVRIWKDSLNDAKQIARETVKAQEAREAEKTAMRQEILNREVSFDILTSAMAALGTLKLDKCSLGRLLDMYDLASGTSK